MLGKTYVRKKKKSPPNQNASLCNTSSDTRVILYKFVLLILQILLYHGIHSNLMLVYACNDISLSHTVLRIVNQVEALLENCKKKI